MSTAFDINNEIEKELSTLKDEEEDADKIAKATHRSLLMLSIKDAAIEMRSEKNNNEKNEENDEEKKIIKFHEKIKKSYLEKLDFLKKQLLN